jgi:hypothetical protein
MPPTRAAEILRALIEGVDPLSGESLSSESVLHHAEVLRALLAALGALEASAARAQRRAQLPGNVGRAWSETEQASLVAAFKAGEPTAALAAKHRRTLRAIEARLERLGLLSAAERTTRRGFTGVSEAQPARRTRSVRGTGIARRTRH